MTLYNWKDRNTERKKRHPYIYWVYSCSGSNKKEEENIRKRKKVKKKGAKVANKKKKKRGTYRFVCVHKKGVCAMAEDFAGGWRGMVSQCLSVEQKKMKYLEKKKN